MRLRDVISFSRDSLLGVRLRSSLILAAMAIGVAAVVVLVSMGESARHFVVGKFASLGTNLLIVLPGRSETTGGAPPLLGETPRDLTLEDARALLRSRHIKDIAPIVVGNAPVSYLGRDREVSVLGTTASFFPMRHLNLARGKGLAAEDFFVSRQICVLGGRLAGELFGPEAPLGKVVRIGGYRYRVVGILAEEGISIGVDLDDIAIIPVASAMTLFNTQSLFRLIAEAKEPGDIAPAREAIVEIIKARHNGEDDITVITQDAVLATFDRIFNALTLTVGAIAAVSLIVAGILTMNVMLVAVSQRTAEIGLLKALGASDRLIMLLFMAEGLFLSLFGAAAGCILAVVVSPVLRGKLGDLAFHMPRWAFGAAVAVALASGVLFSFLPARKAARLEPVAALTRRR